VTTSFPRTFGALAAVLATAGSLPAQQLDPVAGGQLPISQYSPPGVVALWTRQARPQPPYMQPVKVFLPSEGRVTFYDRRPDRAIQLNAPAQAALMVGLVYRFKIDQLPDFPGVEFYPTIELLDRLHPPAGLIDEYPVEFAFSLDDFEWAADGRLITKVIYLESPRTVPLLQVNEPRKTVTLPPTKNALLEADALGRPMAILRLGGRTPNADGSDPEFFGPGGPVLAPNVQSRAAAPELSERPRTEPPPAKRGFGAPVIHLSVQR
jgi:hypothetical protein